MLGAVLMAFLLGGFYVFFSYYQTSTTIKAQNQALFLEEQKEIVDVFDQFQQLMRLTESRLLNSLNDSKALSRILSDRIEQLMGDNFPRIISLNFTPTSDPSVTYTRLGSKLLDLKVQQKAPNMGITYLDNGEFSLNKILYDENLKPFGTLESTFSIGHLLHKNSSEHEISILPIEEAPLVIPQLSFKIPELPYLFVSNRSFSSFWQFLWESKLQIFWALLFGVTLFFIGIGKGLSFNKRFLLKQRLALQEFKKKVALLVEEQGNISTQLAFSQNLLEIKDESTTYTNFLFTHLQERYRQMARQAYAINKLTSQLISENSSNPKSMKDIHSISQESSVILRQLASGYVMREVEETINILCCLENVKAIFLPQLIEKNIKLEIKGNPQNSLIEDNLIFELVLHNIFHTIMERVDEDNLIKIEIKDEGPLQLTFYDNGYDVGDRLQKFDMIYVPENILCLEKKRLRKFIGHLGWSLSFQKEEGLMNSITLLIPRDINKQTLSDNVVSLFDFKTYGE